MNYYTDYLAHYGVKGMKWGVRRYQNADGSLTNAGRKRLAKGVKRAAKQGLFFVDSELSDKNPIIRDSMNSSKQLLSIRSKLDKKSKELDKILDDIKSAHNEYDLMDSDRNNKTIMDYKRKAYKKITGEDFKIEDEMDRVYLRYEDWDQGDNSSINLFVKDRVGIDVGKWNNEVRELNREYSKTCKSIAKELLQEYGDKSLGTLAAKDVKTVAEGLGMYMSRYDSKTSPYIHDYY